MTGFLNKGTNMADWFIATEGVKVVKDSASLWPQIITGVLSAGAAFGGVWYGQWRITQREKEAAAAKLASERLFIATELVFILERFAQRCVGSAQESDGPEKYDQYGYVRIEHPIPEIDYTSVTGDWRALPSDLMYRLSELPVLRQEAASSIDATFYENTPFDGTAGISELNQHASRLGLKAIRLSRCLRHLCEMPEDRLSEQPWSAWRVLWRVRGRCIQKLMHSHRRSRKLYASLQQLTAARDN